ncbi:MAG: hypothetical protein DYG89_41290 [Caldilinea sp. CFX5]|nr:hypothetical protein [Caldilinea sp. CFX5]
MSLVIAIVLVVLPPLAIIWWLDVTVADEFFDNFKPENRAAAAEPRYAKETHPPLYEETIDVAANQSRCTYA